MHPVHNIHDIHCKPCRWCTHNIHYLRTCTRATRVHTLHDFYTYCTYTGMKSNWWHSMAGHYLRCGGRKPAPVLGLFLQALPAKHLFTVSTTKWSVELVGRAPRPWFDGLSLHHPELRNLAHAVDHRPVATPSQLPRKPLFSEQAAAFPFANKAWITSSAALLLPQHNVGGHETAADHAPMTVWPLTRSTYDVIKATFRQKRIRNAMSLPNPALRKRRLVVGQGTEPKTHATRRKKVVFHAVRGDHLLNEILRLHEGH